MSFKQSRAFTIIELLVVIAIIGILAALLLSVLGRAKNSVGGVICLNNCRQLILGWTQYSADNQDRLPYNQGGDRAKTKLAAVSLSGSWVDNVMDWELTPGNTNLGFILQTPLHPYCSTVFSIFHCPSDHVLSQIQRNAKWAGRVRSISMNAMVGNPGESLKDGVNVNNPDYRQFLRLSDIPNPTRVFVFLDEHPDSINDGYFLNRPDDFEWTDLPASYHNGAGSFTFADGHSELHPWRCPTTRPPNRPDAANLPFTVPSAQKADFEWLASVTSVDRDE